MPVVILFACLDLDKNPHLRMDTSYKTVAISAKRVPFSSKNWKKVGLQRRARPRISRGSLLNSYEHLNRSIK